MLLFPQYVFCTVGAKALDHIVDGIHLESLRQVDLGDSRFVEAEGTVAELAIEVGVLVVNGAFVVAVADFVFQHAAAVLDGVDEVVLLEQGERAEYGAAVGRLHAVFQFAQRKRLPGLLQLLVDEQAHGRELHAAMCQSLFYSVVGHCRRSFG